MAINASTFGMAAALVLGGIGVASLATPVFSQDDRMYRPPARPEATFYRDANYSGPAVYVNEAKSNLRLTWPVNSIRIASGRWELCERPNFRGTCRTYDRDKPLLNRLLRGHEVQSIRPLGWGGAAGNNPSLRGMAAQFYSAPARDGYRVQACSRGNANAACASRTADEFCVAMGWHTSAREAMETVSGQVYLADVLCSNTGH